jgi:ribosomal subunit interface protein
MALRVSGKNFDIGESLRTHVQDRVSASVAKFFDGSFSGHVVIDHEGTGYRSDCTLHLTSGVTLHSEGRAHDPYASFEQAADRLEKRLRRYKQRLKAHHGNVAAGTTAEDGIVADYVLETPGVELDENQEINPLIIAERTTALKEMSVSSAVSELDFTGARVVVFRHAGTARVNLVYRRSDGNIGWIDPTENRTSTEAR